MKIISLLRMLHTGFVFQVSKCHKKIAITRYLVVEISKQQFSRFIIDMLLHFTMLFALHNISHGVLKKLPSKPRDVSEKGGIPVDIIEG